MTVEITSWEQTIRKEFFKQSFNILVSMTLSSIVQCSDRGSKDDLPNKKPLIERNLNEESLGYPSHRHESVSTFTVVFQF